MPAKSFATAFCVALLLVANSFAAGDRISDEDFGSDAAVHEEPAAEVPVQEALRVRVQGAIVKPHAH